MTKVNNKLRMSKVTKKIKPYTQSKWEKCIELRNTTELVNSANKGALCTYMQRQLINISIVGEKWLRFQTWQRLYKYLQLKHILQNQITVNNNSIQFFITYVKSQQLQGQLQAQHSVGTIIQFNSIQFNLFMCKT
jgi:hypothetical protein